MGAAFLARQFSNPWRCSSKRLRRRLVSLFAPKTRVAPPARSPPCTRARPSLSGSRHGERSRLASLRQSHLPRNLQTCKWERLGVFLWLQWGEIPSAASHGRNGVGWPGRASLRSACCGKGGDTLSLRCRQCRVSLGRAAPSLVSFVRSSLEMLRRGCNERTVLARCSWDLDLPGGIWRGIPSCGFASPSQKSRETLHHRAQQSPNCLEGVYFCH